MIRPLQPGARKNQQVDHKLPRHLVVEGPIGVGKTTLAGKLAEALGYPLLLEPALENPFLGQFYRSRGANALQTQLFFLLNRAKLVAAVSKDDLLGPNLVADFLMDKDRLFAQLTLSAQELDLYERIHQALRPQPPRPDLVIYLQAPAPELRRRVSKRGIPYEQRMEESYLDAVASAYARYFHGYDEAPLLIVNAGELDFANNNAHLQALLNHLAGMEGGRSYFNPSAKLL